MAKQVAWTNKASKERLNILEYWLEKTGNNKYSSRIDIKLRETIRNIQDNNYLGKQTDYKNTRVTVVGHYLLFYRITSDVIEIVTIFDSRQNPDKLKVD